MHSPLPADRPPADWSPTDWSDDALILIGHGSSDHPESAAAVLQQVDIIKARGVFGDVGAGFLKQAPHAKNVVENLIENGARRRIFLLPVMMHEGVMTREVIPRELGLAGRTTRHAAREGGPEGGQTVVLCDPIGSHPDMAGFIRERIDFVISCFKIEESDANAIDVVLVGHGSGKSDASAEHTRALAGHVRAHGEALNVRALFLEQAPYLKDWQDDARHRYVLVAPLLMSGGRHGAADVPAALGIDPTTLVYDQADGHAAGPFELGERDVWLMRPPAADPALADLILDHVRAFEPAE